MIIISVDDGCVVDVGIQEIAGREKEVLIINYDGNGPDIVAVPLLDGAGQIKETPLAHVNIWTLEPGAMEVNSLCDVDVNSVIAQLEQKRAADSQVIQMPNLKTLNKCY